MESILSPEAFQKQTAVTPEVMAKLRAYARLLEEWNPKINLVSGTTLPDMWRRHFLDSAQLYPLIPPEGKSLADLGSGAGFPGMVLAIMGAPGVTLIERDSRKVAFLRTVAAETGVEVELNNMAIGNVKQGFDTLTTRALAKLPELLNLSRDLLRPSTVCLFLKGKNLDPEIAEAQKEWVMDVRKIPSLTEPESFILRLGDIVAK